MKPAPFLAETDFPGRGLRQDFGLGEEEGDLVLRVFQAVGPMNGVRFDALGEQLADRAFGSVSRVRRAHDFTVLRNSVLALQDLHDNRFSRHGGDEAAVERAFLVNGIESASLLFGQLDTLLGNNAQTSSLEHGIDLAGQVTLRGVGLDDGKRALESHLSSPGWTKGVNPAVPLEQNRRS